MLAVIALAVGIIVIVVILQRKQRTPQGNKNDVEGITLFLRQATLGASGASRVTSESDSLNL
jgi:hypothetical protein